MIFQSLYLLFLVCASASAKAEYTEAALRDQIISLPRSSELLSNQFSGYLDVTATKNLHYIYFESERNPANDSIVFWTNGGPGCSGLLGLFTEFGPWRPVQNGSLVTNPHSWTKLASLVFLEQPVGVGFSYGTAEEELLAFNDYRAATDNILAIKAFFRRFPERAHQPFYIASESYGGHYIPQWTLQVLGDESLRGTFRGMLVGNPFTSYASGSVAMVHAMWGLQMVPQPLWNEFVSHGCDDLDASPYALMSTRPQCFEIMEDLFDIAGPINPYALSYPICANGTLNNGDSHASQQSDRAVRVVSSETRKAPPAWQAGLSKQAMTLLKVHERITYSSEFAAVIERHYTSKGTTRAAAALARKARRKFDTASVTPSGDLESTSSAVQRRRLLKADTVAASRVTGNRDVEGVAYDPCTQDYTTAYLNDPEVRAALHVTSLLANKPWAECDDRVNELWSFSDYLADTTPLYAAVFNHPLKPAGFKMLIFSGDDDGVCATVGTQNWVYRIRGTEVTSLYKPWHYRDSRYGRQQGGFLTKFADSLSFATVRRAGHEVPAYQPEMALELFARFLDGTMFDTSTSKSSSDKSNGGDTEQSASVQNGVFSDALSVIIAIVLLIFGVTGAVFGCVTYMKSRESERGSLLDAATAAQNTL